MANPHTGNIERSTAESEHIGPDWTGDNISAKRSAAYVWNSSSLEWERMTQPGAPTGFLPFEFDDIAFSNPDANGNYQTAVVKHNGNIVTTITFTFDANNNITEASRT